jgi:uncharacterized protein with PQ loop repeat
MFKNATKIVSIPISGLFLTLICCLLAMRNGFNSREIQDYGRILGGFATILVFFQYLPQMITTWQLQGPGALSITLMCVQAPGGLANALFLWMGQKNHWTTWLSIFVAAIQMLILLVMCLWFKFRRGRRMSSGEWSIPSVYSINSPLT